MREKVRKKIILSGLMVLLLFSILYYLRLSFFEVRETVAYADRKAREASESWSMTQSLLLVGEYWSAEATWREAETAIEELTEVGLLKGLGLLDPEVEKHRTQLKTLAASSARKIEESVRTGTGAPFTGAARLSRSLGEVSRAIAGYAQEQSLYFQNLLLFAALLLLTGVFGLIVVEQRNRSLLKAEQRARKLSRHLISDYENSMHAVALDLHDDIAQDLYLVRIEHDSSRREILLDGTIEKIRRLSYDIRPGEAASLPLAQGLRSLLEETAKKAGWSAQFSETGLRRLRLPYEVRIHLYRMVQEALTNIRKHANAHGVSIKAVATYPELKIRITDDGCGFDPDKQNAKNETGLGIRGMRERIAILDGLMSIKSRIDAGTRMEIVLDVKDYIDGAS